MLLEEGEEGKGEGEAAALRAGNMTRAYVRDQMDGHMDGGRRAAGWEHCSAAAGTDGMTYFQKYLRVGPSPDFARERD